MTALATLPELCRRYQALEHGIPTDSAKFISDIRELQQTKSEIELLALEEKIEPVLRFAPFDVDKFRIFTEERIVEAGKVYQEYCASCHQFPNLDTPNPAYSLYEMARQQDEHEFLARMLLGVKGTPEIGLSNPLTLTEIGAMRAYLLSSSEND